MGFADDPVLNQQELQDLEYAWNISNLFIPGVRIIEKKADARWWEVGETYPVIATDIFSSMWTPISAFRPFKMP
jgi:hypothetical protein